MICHILTAVWGKWHTETFVSLNLSSLLSEGNLPAFQKAIPSVYYIYTCRSDAPTIRKAPSVVALRRVITVRIVALPDEAFSHPIDTHMKIWRTGVDRARRNGAFIMTNPADMVWADGSFDTLARLLTSGKKAVYAMFVRVTHETILDDLQSMRVADGAVLSCGPRRLMSLAQRHMHPLLAAYTRDSEYFPFHPEYVIWPVGKEGFLMRSLATTVLVFDPSHLDVDAHFSLQRTADINEVAFVEDSDELFGVSLTPLLKDRNWYFTRQSADIDVIGAWWNVFDGAVHLPLARSRFRFHVGDMTPDLWQRVDLASDFFVNQCVAAREIIRIGRVLSGIDHVRSVQCLATLAYAGRLRRRWTWRGPVTIFAPRDAAFDVLPAERFEHLLSEDGLSALLAAALGHVADTAQELPWDGDAPLPCASLRALDGRRIALSRDGAALTANGRHILGMCRLPNGHIIYEVDGFLTPP